MSIGWLIALGFVAFFVTFIFAFRVARKADSSFGRERRRYIILIWALAALAFVFGVAPMLYYGHVTPTFGEVCEAAGGHRVETYRDTVCVDDEGRLMDP